MLPGRIIDAHHHLWELDDIKHTWLAERGVTRFFGDPAPIQKNYYVPDFKLSLSKRSQTGTVWLTQL